MAHFIFTSWPIRATCFTIDRSALGGPVTKETVFKSSLRGPASPATVLLGPHSWANWTTFLNRRGHSRGPCDNNDMQTLLLQGLAMYIFHKTLGLIFRLLDRIPLLFVQKKENIFSVLRIRQYCMSTEAEFLEVIGTNVFLLAIHSHLYVTDLLRTLKIMSRNLNEILRSWIWLQYNLGKNCLR